MIGIAAGIIGLITGVFSKNWPYALMSLAFAILSLSNYLEEHK